MNLLATKLLLDRFANVDNYMPREQGSQVQNLAPFRVLVEAIRGVPGISEVIRPIDSNQYYKSGSAAVPTNDISRTLSRDANALREFLKYARMLTSSTVAAESSESDIYVRFPKADNLPALTQQLDTLEKILEQTILDPKIEGKLVVKSVENGSFIIQLFLGSTAAVSLVGGIAWSAAVVFKKYQEALLVKMHVEALEVRNESLGEIQEAQKRMLKNVVEAEARHLEKEIFGGEENPERLQRIKHSIELMQQLLEKGAEVHPALMAPEQVKNLFPDYQKLGSVESRIKQIAEKVAA